MHSCSFSFLSEYNWFNTFSVDVQHHKLRKSYCHQHWFRVDPNRSNYNSESMRKDPETPNQPMTTLWLPNRTHRHNILQPLYRSLFIGNDTLQYRKIYTSLMIMYIHTFGLKMDPTSWIEGFLSLISTDLTPFHMNAQHHKPLTS